MYAHIVFASTYPPVACGIGSYASYVVGAMPPGRASVVAFDPERYGAPLASGHAPDGEVRVEYVLTRPAADPGRLMAAVSTTTPVPLDHTVLWFQHAPDIWPRFPELVRSVAGFPARKVASLHVVHFQSPETPSGLRTWEHRMLHEILPLLDRVTVFTPSAREAVCRAFPHHAAKVTVLRHGVHTPHPIGRGEARRLLARYLATVPDAVRPHGTDTALMEALGDPAVVLVGALGFLQWGKGFEVAYALRDALRARFPGRRIVGLVMGTMREPYDRRNRRLLTRLAAAADGDGRFLVTARPPDAVFQAALRAVDLNVYWPDSPTQSGRIAHALGVGATVIGRDIEGVGETLREVGAPVCANFEQLVDRSTELIDNPAYAKSLSTRYRRYALEHSWTQQARRHLELAEMFVAARELATAAHDS